MMSKKRLIIIVLVGILLAAGGFVFAIQQDSQNEDSANHAEEQQEREPQAAAVVSAHEIATNAGIEILQRGGTAADASVAVAATLSVVEPWYSSALGGGTWALYYDADTNEVTSVDGVGPVGGKASLENYRSRAESWGMHQVVVPGAWDGWMLWLEEYGKLDLPEILAPAIQAAREGYEVSPEMAHWLDVSQGRIYNDPETREIYLQDGSILQEGDTVYQHNMADTFENLANAYSEALDEGNRAQGIQAARDYFYRGPLAEAIVHESEREDGYLTLEDFSNFEAEIVDPLSLQYNEELTVFQNPPNSQGITMLSALNVLKGYDFSNYDINDPEAVHLQIEALKRGFTDRYYHVGDPDRAEVPVEAILSEDHARRHRAEIDKQQAASWPIDDVLDEPAANTTTFHIVDEQGNGAAVTTSLGAQVLVVGETGIHVNNRMRFMSLEEGNANVVEPGYKVRHTSNPYIVKKNNQLYILGGNIGADTQSQGQLQQFISIIEFDLSAQEAVDRPRFVSTAFPPSTVPHSINNELEVEDDFPPALTQALREKGHRVTSGTNFGNAGIIVLKDDGNAAEVGVEHRNETSAGEVLLPNED